MIKQIEGVTLIVIITIAIIKISTMPATDKNHMQINLCHKLIKLKLKKLKIKWSKDY